MGVIRMAWADLLKISLYHGYIPQILLAEGFTVSGSDSKESALTRELIADGAIVNYPQAAENITDDIDVVVFTAAIHPDNVEYAAAVSKGIPMLTRAQLLGQIMDNYPQSIAISGTHGKTTTTSMISQILLCAEADPTISVGGILKAIGGNIRVGPSDTFVTEACEYTNSFWDFRPRYSLILNIEEDHMDFFKDLADIRHSFRVFAENTKAGGTIILNRAIEAPEEITGGLDVNVLTYSIDGQADYTAKDISFDGHACASYTACYKGEPLYPVTLRVPGIHNVGNSLAVIALMQTLGMEPSIVQ